MSLVFNHVAQDADPLDVDFDGITVRDLADPGGKEDEAQFVDWARQAADLPGEDLF